jgi:rpsU-divergently transcribed protein
MNEWNNQLRKELLERRTNLSSSSSQTTSDLLFDAIQLRLSYIKNLLQSKRWHEGMAIGIHPTQIVTTQQQIHDIVTIIAEHLNEQNKDGQSLSYFEKLGISGIYITTELHMLNDQSYDYYDTWEFLKTRISEWDTLRQNQQQGLPFIPTTSIVPTTDTLYTLSHIVSSLSSGVVSVLYPAASQYLVQASNQSINNNNNPMINNLVGTITTTIPSLFQQAAGVTSYSQEQQQPLSNSTTTTTPSNDGTDPSHYNTTKK